MEQGGACPGVDPCWWRTSVLPAKIRLENLSMNLESVIGPDDFEQVVQIVNRTDFRSAITARAPTCPVTFDGDYSLTLATQAGTFTDKFASGCILDDEYFSRHSYRDLFRVLDEMRRSHFPGVLPF